MPEGLDEIFAEVAAAGESVEVEPVDNPGEVDDSVESFDDAGTDVVEDQVTDEPVVTDESDLGEFDWSAYADRNIPITVQGETLEVPLSELRNGYMRQQDYTRKTQELSERAALAQWAQDVQTALEVDPEGTLQAIARAFNLDVPIGGEPEDPFADVDPDVRPVVEELRRTQAELDMLRRQQEAVAQRELVQEVKREVDMLQAKLGDAFDPRASLQYAAAYNIPLEKAAYIVMAERNLHSQTVDSEAARQAAEAAEARKAQEEAKRAEAKRKASTTAKGSFVASEVPADEFDTIDELFELILSNS